MDEPRPADIAAEAKAFAASRACVQIATTGGDGEPLASYAPCVRPEDGDLFILVSELAEHGENLKSGTASILFIEDEGDARQVYARRRLRFQCLCSVVPRDAPQYAGVLAALKNRQGEIVDTLASLGDFFLVRLRPVSGRYVRGFGQAYEIDGRFECAQPVRGRA